MKKVSHRVTQITVKILLLISCKAMHSSYPWLDNIMYIFKAIGYNLDTFPTPSFIHLSLLLSPLLTSLGINEQVTYCHVKIKSLYNQHFISHMNKWKMKMRVLLAYPTKIKSCDHKEK